MTTSIEKASLMANQFEKDLGGADKVTKALGKEGKAAFDQYKTALQAVAICIALDAIQERMMHAMMVNL